MKPESSEVLRRPGLIGVGDMLLGFHVQEQGWHSWEGDHLAALMDPHKGDPSSGRSIAHLRLRGRLQEEIGLTERGGLYVGGLVN